MIARLFSLCLVLSFTLGLEDWENELYRGGHEYKTHLLSAKDAFQHQSSSVDDLIALHNRERNFINFLSKLNVTSSTTNIKVSKRSILE